MKYLISGSSGFIGSNLSKTLLKQNQTVQRIPRDLLYSYFELKSYIEEFNPDYIIHLAAFGNHSFQQDFDNIVHSNINATVTLLQASKDVDYKSFINTSTSSVLLKRQTFYSASKRSTEELCKAFAQEHSKNVISVRPFSVYGPGEADFRFIPSVIRSAKYEKELSLVEEPTHDWIYIDDFLSGLLTVSKANLPGEVINIGTSKCYTNRQVFDIIQEIHSEKIPYKKVENLRVYDQEQWVADNDVLKFLGWEQKYSLRDGLKKTYEAY